ncbi:MAG: hypothetical protein LBH20_11340 [Treponema sp.]|nr:hypothetical protein [Treponema sp.]
MSKKPRFFCDNCGVEVDRNTKACPQCGRFFASIRCPSCGFTGDEQTFAAGCPSCGYSTHSPPTALPHKKKNPAGPLPLWVYILAVCAFICICAALFYTLRR